MLVSKKSMSSPIGQWNFLLYYFYFLSFFFHKKEKKGENYKKLSPLACGRHPLSVGYRQWPATLAGTRERAKPSPSMMGHPPWARGLTPALRPVFFLCFLFFLFNFSHLLGKEKNIENKKKITKIPWLASEVRSFFEIVITASNF